MTQLNTYLLFSFFFFRLVAAGDLTNVTTAQEGEQLYDFFAPRWFNVHTQLHLPYHHLKKFRNAEKSYNCHVGKKAGVFLFLF